MHFRVLKGILKLRLRKTDEYTKTKCKICQHLNKPNQEISFSYSCIRKATLTHV